MAEIFGAVLNYQKIIDLMQQKSTDINLLVHKLILTYNILVKIADDDLKQMISVGLGEPAFDPLLPSPAVTADFTAIRDWQSAIKNYSDNYFGTGKVSDASYHCAKRANPLV